MKICSRCKTKKSFDDFGIQNRRGRTEFISCCKRCRQDYQNGYNKNRRKIDPAFKAVAYAASSNWAKKNPEKVNTILKRHRHKPEAKARRAKQIKLRRQTDSSFRLRRNISSRIVSALTLHKTSKSGNLWKLLGCSLFELRLHLENQFQLGMTWENYGPAWHVDHIRPCDSFSNLSDPEQQKLCFHWSNLQPLWAEQNLIKKDTLCTVIEPAVHSPS